MSRICCKNKRYNGLSAGVNFVDGVGVSNDSRLLSWFMENGYEVLKELEEMNYKELVEYAKEQGMNGIGTKRDELLEILKKMEGKPDA